MFNVAQPLLFSGYTIDSLQFLPVVFDVYALLQKKNK